MKKFALSDMKGGWYIGDFSPCAFRTLGFEVGVHEYKKGQRWPAHVHHHMKEINLVMNGVLQLNDEVFHAGDIIMLEKDEPVFPVFLSDCTLVVVKIPSVPGDKTIVSKELK